MGKRRVLYVIVGLILLIMCGIVLIYASQTLSNNHRNVREEKEYVYSEEIEEGTFSPTLIHVPIGVYKGEVPPQAFSKSCYLFITRYIPEFYKECTSPEKMEKYYNDNKNELKKILGIRSLEDFNNIIKTISGLNGKLEYESSRFIMDEVYTDNDGIEANLYIKYKNNPELKFVMRVSNNNSEVVSAISFLTE